MSAVRIANASGFYGDRLAAMREQLVGGDVDYVTGDYLAELTMLILGRDQLKDPSLGYAKTFLRQLQDCLGLAVERGVRIVSNAGGLNPAGLAARIEQLAQDVGLQVSVAYVDGDDLRSVATEFGFGNALTANAYLGAFGIAEALRREADIVVTGRVTDASLTVGPAIAAHGWGRDDLDELAGALVAGHVIECGAQATGGNFSGFDELVPGVRAGFPIAEVAADGSSVITKHPGTGGAVTVDTVTAQLVYEIGSPAYLNPDVVARLDTARISPVDEDRVRIDGVRGGAPPPTTKVCLNHLGGYRNSADFVLTGLDIERKAELLRKQLTAALSSDPPQAVTWRLDQVASQDPQTQWAATSLLRCHVRDEREAPVGRAFSSAAVELALASYPGFTTTAPPSRATPFGIYRAAYAEQSRVPHRVHIDGDTVDIPAPPRTAPAGPPAPAMTPATIDGPTRRAPLGSVAYARSGDKGGDANVGVWIPAEHPARDRAFAWVVGLLTPARLRELLPETADLDIEVWPLPNLYAVNVVTHGLLGDGVAASTRFDPQAKALGEWLRARVVDIPEELLAPHEVLRSSVAPILREDPA
ncbi:exopolyphosphatase [Flexivirga endophytica]|uniref:Exopolyphosphatase n=1 Tax=Flexivirga endophytica TaxID=1849103 RepID=A0A916T1S7_9MICO|nr:acyclic terpene utilization AtuA family protein [Flexivirga endophytica]GGB27190.1 exopolyphosphatase [Flexivirga endophytica]GHB55681.1 exopolyphosphatase [Flexivirga endophytica]